MRKRGGGRENDSKVHEEECNVLLRLIGYKSLAKRKKRRVFLYFFLVGIQERENGADLESERKSQSS